MLFGIDYARNALQKLREKEEQAYQNGYDDADQKANHYRAEKDENYRKGYEDGFNDALMAHSQFKPEP